MMARRVPMAYDSELGRWVAEGQNKLYGLRCGEGIKLHLGKNILHGTLELGRTSWFIVSDDVALGLLEARRYTVTIEI